MAVKGIKEKVGVVLDGDMTRDTQPRKQPGHGKGGRR
jgi:hypothetical protein